MDLLQFADDITVDPPAEAPPTLNARDRSYIVPALTRQQGNLHLVSGQTYTLSGADVYLARDLGDWWLLEDINRSWRSNRGRGVVWGYVIRGGRIYTGCYEFGHQAGHCWHHVHTANITVRDFSPCGVQTKTIEFSLRKKE